MSILIITTAGTAPISPAEKERNVAL